MNYVNPNQCLMYTITMIGLMIKYRGQKGR